VRDVTHAGNIVAPSFIVSPPDDDALAARRPGLVIIRIGVRGAAGTALVAVAAPAPTAVDLHPLAFPRDAVTFAAADRGCRVAKR